MGAQHEVSFTVGRWGGVGASRWRAPDLRVQGGQTPGYRAG
ncbi:hypothetical protein FM103_05715 [Corynebacterium xerosis]|nr:hypothetical protein FM103_05715 [Corynebacterium xerosis]